jgi:hypothetical protein
MEVDMSTASRIAAIGVLFAFKFLFGIWLTRSGKPYSVVVLTIHKIISLLTVVLIVIAIRHLRLGVGMSAVEIGAGIVTGLLFLSAILSGGLLSTDKPTHAAILIAHKVTPFLTVLSTAVTIYSVA